MTSHRAFLTKVKNISFSLADFCIFCESTLSRTSIHHNVGVRVVTPQSIHSHELLWNTEFLSSISAVGIARVLGDTWQHNMGGFNGNGCRPHLLLFGRRLSKATRRFSNFKNSTILVSSSSFPSCHVCVYRHSLSFFLLLQKKTVRWSSRRHQLRTSSRRR